MTVRQNLPADLQNFSTQIGLTNGPELASAIANQGGASTEDAITASTTQTQVGARQLSAAFSHVSTAAGNDAVRAPQALPGSSFVLVNTSGQTITLFPFSGDAINAAGANNSVSVANVTTSFYCCTAAGQWWGGATTNEQ